jgi:hypothetical protein
MAETKSRSTRTTSNQSKQTSGGSKKRSTPRSNSNSKQTSGGSKKRSTPRSNSNQSKQTSGGTKKRSTPRSNSNSNHDHSPREIVIEAVRQLQELVGRPIESVTGIEKHGKEWKLSLEVLELQRVPNTTDVLGNYEVRVDENGELKAVHRTQRYARAESREE